MIEKIQKLIADVKEAFRPLPTREEVEANFPHVESCPKKSRLVVRESLDPILGGLACTSIFTTRRSLTCPDCNSNQLFK